jgi:hypothetical protein
MDSGSQEHREHNRGVKLAVFYKWLALVALLAALCLALWMLR